MRVLAAVLLALLPASTPPPAASAATLEIVSLGFAGRARLGAWTPVWVEVVSPAGGVDGVVVIEAPALAGQPVVRFSTPVRAAAGARVRVFIPAIFFDSRRPGTVHLEDAGGRLATFALPPVRPVEALTVVLSAEPVGVEAAAAAGRLDVVYLRPELLPPVWQAYEAVRLVIVRTLDERRLDDRQREALLHWVWTGGRVLGMPSGDDVRALHGPTLRALRSGQTGRGVVAVWDRDAAAAAARGDPASRRAWDALLAEPPAPGHAGFEGTLPPGRPVPTRVNLIVGGLAFLYVLAVRRLSRLLAGLRPAAVLLAGALLASATLGAWRLAAVAGREASGVVTAAVVEVLPETGHGVVMLLARVISPLGGPFAVSTGPSVLLRPDPPDPVVLAHTDRTEVRGRGSGARLAGTGVVPAAISGTYRPRGEGADLTVSNRSGRRLDGAWVFAGGRVQPLAAIDGAAQVALDGQEWRPPDRLARTNVNHALLLWAFSRLGADAILKGTPAWLVGWWHDPAVDLRWGARAETAPVLVLVPLAATP